MIRAENEKMQEEIELIRTEADYVKYLAKKRLGLVEPGEIKYYVSESSTGTVN